jgi:uncharacterized membrane protein YphA (DoxX/SURF4 family)/peroxiredoxin
MGIPLLCARVGLALVFAFAGAAKLVGLERTRATLAAFGVPRGLVAPAAIALPIAELAVAAALIVPASARVGAVVAVVLLAAFSGAVARLLARGERPDCACFGGLGSTPVGTGTLTRNLVLAGVSAFVVIGGPGREVGSVLGGVDPLIIVGVVLLVLVLGLQGWFSYQLFRQNGRLMERVQTLELEAIGSRSTAQGASLSVRSVAPPFELPDLAGRPRSLENLLAGGVPVVLAFTDPDCGACGPLLPRLARLRDERADVLELAVITRGDEGRVRAQINGFATRSVLLQGDDVQVARAYGASRVPSAVLIDRDGRIASPVVTGDVAIESLLRSRPAASIQPQAVG